MLTLRQRFVERAAGRLRRDAVDQQPDQAGAEDGDEDWQQATAHGC